MKFAHKQYWARGCVGKKAPVDQNPYESPREANRAPDSKSNSPLNKQMSPLSGGAFLGTIAFAFILYKHHDIVRALLVGGAGFAGAYWVMWAGEYLGRRGKKKP
jgi:hypothetical protein